MKAGTLNKVASHLFREDHDNKLRFKIYQATKKKHPKDSVSLDAFSEEEREELKTLLGKIFFTKTVQEWRKVSKSLTKANQTSLAGVIDTFTTNAPINMVISVPFTLKEMEQLDYLGI